MRTRLRYDVASNSRGIQIWTFQDWRDIFHIMRYRFPMSRVSLRVYANVGKYFREVTRDSEVGETSLENGKRRIAPPALWTNEYESRIVISTGEWDLSRRRNSTIRLLTAGVDLRNVPLLCRPRIRYQRYKFHNYTCAAPRLPSWAAGGILDKYKHVPLIKDATMAKGALIARSLQRIRDFSQRCSDLRYGSTELMSMASRLPAAISETGILRWSGLIALRRKDGSCNWNLGIFLVPILFLGCSNTSSNNMHIKCYH